MSPAIPIVHSFITEHGYFSGNIDFINGYCIVKIIKDNNPELRVWIALDALKALLIIYKNEPERLNEERPDVIEVVKGLSNLANLNSFFSGNLELIQPVEDYGYYNN